VENILGMLDRLEQKLFEFIRGGFGGFILKEASVFRDFRDLKSNHEISIIVVSTVGSYACIGLTANRCSNFFGMSVPLL
jgi:hypothetical protein